MSEKSAQEIERDRETPEKSVLREQQIAALGASIDGLAVFDSDERFIYVNEAHAKIYGFSGPDELIGRTWHVLYDGPELERFQKWIMPVFFEKGHWRGEAVGRKKDGSHFPQEVSLSVVKGGGLVCVVRDITERKKMEEKRAIIVEISRSIGQSVDYADTIERIATAAVPKFADYCVLNLKALRRFSEQTRIATAFPHDESALKQLAKQAFCGDQESFCVFNVGPDHSPLPALAALGVSSYVYAPLFARGSVIGGLALLRTSRHSLGNFEDCEYEAALGIASRAALAIENSRLFVEAREAVHLQENLMTAVSHDLKNPLMAIGINVEILSRIAQNSPLEPQLRGISHNIKVSVDQMSGLVSQLLEFEKLRSGELSLRKQNVRISDLFEQIATVFAALTDRKSVRLETRIASPLSFVQCDGERVIRVLSNLVGNAFKFTHSGGRVTVEALAGDREVIFKVSDTGVGIRAEDLEHVFELHWQSSGAADQGTGLGLTIAKGIVDAHGGRIWAESKLGVGSVFSFAIPLT